MLKLETTDVSARERMEDASSLAHKVAIVAAVFVRAAAELTEMSGFDREDAVLEGLTAEFVGTPHPSENEWEKFMDDITPLSGWAERGTDWAWEMLPVKRLAESFLRSQIRTAYVALKGAGAIG